MQLNPKLKYILILFSLLLHACATTGVNQQVADFQRPAKYVHFFEVLDRIVVEADARNAASFPVSGFPYLRTNRFLTGLKRDLDTDARKEQWVRWLQQLDMEARKKEIHNLPSNAVRDLALALGEKFDRDTLQARAALYSDKMLNHDLRRADFFEVVEAAAVNIDEYKTAYRIIGLYPITSLPVAFVTNRVQGEFRNWHQKPLDQLPIQGELIVYGPSAPAAYSRLNVSVILNRWRSNALGAPIPSDTDTKTLAAMFAPLIRQDQVHSYDRIGAVVWQDGRVRVDFQQPTVYYYLTHARFKGEPVLQLNYVFWYSARKGPNSPWIERGDLDGLTVRVSLDNDGAPFMLDIMNTCGCYHFYVPDPKRVKRIIPAPGEIDAFVPRWMPESFPQRRLDIQINSGWHQVVHIGAAKDPTVFLPYRLVAYDQLEMLPHPDLRFESIFNSRGIAKDSDRLEFIIFFPMGIPDVGSMRQRGHHAVKLVGRSDFEDPDIFDKSFEFY
ncbi:MAG: hypothetical protein JRF38_07775 [Deltaproteobacteria bacterium]|nr:hypothetical protein [Deltaproteobacteria bacterium]